MAYEGFMVRPFQKDTIKKLEKYPEFRFKIKDKEKFINFMILMYDPKSDIRRDYPDLLTRKREVAKIVGFKIGENHRFPDHIEEVLLGDNHEYNVAMIRFAQMHGIPDYDVLVVTREMLARELTSAIEARDPKARAQIQKNMDVDLIKIEELENRIFTGIPLQKERESLYHVIEKFRVPRPENVADDISNKTLTLPEVYPTR